MMWNLLFMYLFIASFSRIVKTHQGQKCDIRIWHIDLMENILVHAKNERTPRQISVLGKIDRMVEMASEETAFMPCSLLKTYSALILPGINLPWSEMFHEHSSDDNHDALHKHPETFVDKSGQQSSEEIETGLVETTVNDVPTKTTDDAPEGDFLDEKSESYEMDKDQDDHNKSKQFTSSAKMEHEKLSTYKDQNDHNKHKSVNDSREEEDANTWEMDLTDMEIKYSESSVRDSREEGDTNTWETDFTDMEIEDSESTNGEMLVYSADQIPPMDKDEVSKSKNSDAAKEGDAKETFDFTDMEIEDSESTNEEMLVYSADQIPPMDKDEESKSKDSDAAKEGNAKETLAGLAGDAANGESVRLSAEKDEESHNIKYTSHESHPVKDTKEESDDSFWKLDFTDKAIEHPDANGEEISVFTADQIPLMKKEDESKKSSKVSEENAKDASTSSSVFNIETVELCSSNTNGGDFHGRNISPVEQHNVNTDPSTIVYDSSGYKAGVDIMTDTRYSFETEFLSDRRPVKSFEADSESHPLKDYFTHNMCYTCRDDFRRSSNLICTYANFFTRQNKYGSQNEYRKTYISSKLHKGDQVNKIIHKRLFSECFRNKNVKTSILSCQYTNMMLLRCSSWDLELGSNSSHRVQYGSNNYTDSKIYSASKNRQVVKHSYEQCTKQTLIHPEKSCTCSVMCQYLGLFLEGYNNNMYLEILSGEGENNISTRVENENGESKYDVEELAISTSLSNSHSDDNNNNGFNVGNIVESQGVIKMEHSLHAGSEAVISKENDENILPGIENNKRHIEKVSKHGEPWFSRQIDSRNQSIDVDSNREIKDPERLNKDFVHDSANERDQKRQSMESRPFYVQESQHNAQIQNLELMIVKLENKLLSKSMEKAENFNSVQNLQNHVLKVEIDLLKLNQTYQRLQSEHEALKSEQKKASSFPIQIRTNPHHPYCSVRKKKAGNELMIQQKTKIVELSELVYKQSRDFKELHSQHHRLEEQNKELFQMMINQNSLISKMMLQLNEMNEKSMKESMKSNELYLQLQLLQTQDRRRVLNQGHFQSSFYPRYRAKHSKTETNDDNGSILLTRLLIIVYSQKYAEMSMKIVMLQSRLNIPCPRICLFNKVIVSNVVPFPVLSWLKCETIPGTLAYQKMSAHTHSSHEDVALDNDMKTEYSVTDVSTSTPQDTENKAENSKAVSPDKDTKKPKVQSNQPWASNLDPLIFPIPDDEEDGTDAEVSYPNTSNEHQANDHQHDPPREAIKRAQAESSKNDDMIFFPTKEDGNDKDESGNSYKGSNSHEDDSSYSGIDKRAQAESSKTDDMIFFPIEEDGNDKDESGNSYKGSNSHEDDSSYSGIDKRAQAESSKNDDMIFFPIEEDGNDEDESGDSYSYKGSNSHEDDSSYSGIDKRAQAESSKNDDMIFFPIEEDGNDQDESGNSYKGSNSHEDDSSYPGMDLHRQRIGKGDGAGPFDEDNDAANADEFNDDDGGLKSNDRDEENDEEGNDEDKSVDDRHKENEKDGSESNHEKGNEEDRSVDDRDEEEEEDVNEEDRSIDDRDDEDEEDVNEADRTTDDRDEENDEEVNKGDRNVDDKDQESDENVNKGDRSVDDRDEGSEEDGSKSHGKEVSKGDRNVDDKVEGSGEDGSVSHDEEVNGEDKSGNAFSDDSANEDSNTQSNSRNRSSEEIDSRSDDRDNDHIKSSTQNIGDEEGEAQSGKMNASGKETINDSEQYSEASKAGEKERGQVRGTPQEKTDTAERIRKENRLAQEAHQQPLLDTVELETSDDKPADCHDLYKQGKVFNGSSNIFVRGLNSPVKVMCHMQDGGWTVLLKRENGDVDFYQDFKQYKNGFGDPSAEHYIGNEVIHYLTHQKKYALKVTLMNWEEESTAALYNHFLIDNEETGYRLHIQGFSGTAGDGLGKHNGMKFSTHDVDNDLLKSEMGGSCAKRFKGAGWYYRCYMSNLMGVYYKSAAIPPKKFDGITWKPWLGPNYSMKKVVMSVRPLESD